MVIRKRGVRKLIPTAVVLISVSSALGVPRDVRAQAERRGEFAVSLTWAHADDDFVRYQPFGFLVEGTGYLTEYFGLTAELSYSTRTRSGETPFFGGTPYDITYETITVMGGLRIRYPNESIVTPSLRVMAGLGRRQFDTSFLGRRTETSENLPTLVFGGSVDLAVSDRIAIRVQPDLMLFDVTGPTMIRLALGVRFGF